MGSEWNRLPIATYRLQFNREFKFKQAERIIEYLQDLGISDVYASPLFLASPESTHGYDVCAFDQINPNLGAPDDFDRLAKAIRGCGLGLLLDMVPNHMGNHPNNRWWRSVLEVGPASRFASYFDIDWEARSDRKIVLPVLGDRYGSVLSRGELELTIQNGEPTLTYFEKSFPLSPESRKGLTLTDVLEINRSPERLHELIHQQHYRLAYWRAGQHEINFRRFFDVTDLVSVRVEDPAVFQATHAFVFELLKVGHITGLRIDHPDGLQNPKAYFDRLQQMFGETGENARLYVVVEKILSDGEQLPDDWPVNGTTGYDFLNFLNGLFVAPENEDSLSKIYRDFTGADSTYQETALKAKRYVLERLFPSEVNGLARRLRLIADKSVEGVDFAAGELRQAMVELIAAFPVYRTYARPGIDALPHAEAGTVEAAVKTAANRVPNLRDAIHFLSNILLRPLDKEKMEFSQRFQQLTGPATAKGLEDTAFYRYVPFVALNEVGGNPGKFGISIEEFHSYNQQKQTRWPHSLLATATHDTKRGEDLRARLNVLSEMPVEWATKAFEWHDSNRKLKTSGAPTPEDEYLLYQTLAGSWTDASAADLETYIQRIHQYVEKATREAKVSTNWTDPNTQYERATRGFAEAILRDDGFRASLTEFARSTAFFGVFNSLSQMLLKICSPGVPDFYQGTELWDFNFVDPDNRRPVDYDLRKKLLARVKSVHHPAELLQNTDDGAVKMFVLWRALHFRNKHRELFDFGRYVPIGVRGVKRSHILAFARDDLIAIAPRWPFLLAGGKLKAPVGSEIWGNTELILPNDQRPVTEVITGRRLNQPQRVAEILSDFPVALLHYGNTTR